MQITLDQTEIHEAVENYVRSQIALAPNQTVAIDFTAGRGEKGLTATLDIRTAAVAAPKANMTPITSRSIPASQSIAQAVMPKAAEEPAPEEEEAPAPAAISSGEERVDPAAGEQDETSDPAPEPEKASKPKASPFSKMTAPAEGGEAQGDAPAEPKPSKPAGSIFSKAG